MMRAAELTPEDGASHGGRRSTRTGVAVLLMFTVIVLAPLAWYWLTRAEFAVRYANTTQDWRANHRAKVELEIWAALIAGAPAAGAMVGWIVATLRARARGLAASAGALLGAVLVLLYAWYVLVSNFEIVW